MSPESELSSEGRDIDRRYVCTSCDDVVRARYFGTGSFAIGCGCTTVPVVPQMGQAETPDNWQVERPKCCRDTDVSTLETVYGERGQDYRCPDCGTTYTWDGEMAEPGEQLGERESTPCEECGDPVYFDNAPAYYKTPDDRFWHPLCAPVEPGGDEQ